MSGKKQKRDTSDDFWKWKHAEEFMKLMNPKLPRIRKIDWSKPPKGFK